MRIDPERPRRAGCAANLIVVAGVVGLAACSRRYDLTGDWKAGFTVGSPQLQVERVSIRQVGDHITATKITGDEYVPAGRVTIRGTYNGNPFSAEQVCAERGFQHPSWSNVTISISDANHFKVEGGCSGGVVWERIATPAAAKSPGAEISQR